MKKERATKVEALQWQFNQEKEQLRQRLNEFEKRAKDAEHSRG